MYGEKIKQHTNKFTFSQQFKVRPKNIVVIHWHFFLELISLHGEKFFAVHGPIGQLDSNQVEVPDSPLKPNLNVLNGPILWIY